MRFIFLFVFNSNAIIDDEEQDVSFIHHVFTRDVDTFISDGEWMMIVLCASVGKIKHPDVHSEIKDTIYYAIFRNRTHFELATRLYVNRENTASRVYNIFLTRERIIRIARYLSMRNRDYRFNVRKNIYSSKQTRGACIPSFFNTLVSLDNRI